MVPKNQTFVTKFPGSKFALSSASISDTTASSKAMSKPTHPKISAQAVNTLVRHLTEQRREYVQMNKLCFSCMNSYHM